MLEGNEFLDLATETGYRLCLTTSSVTTPSSDSFSFSWCPNEGDREGEGEGLKEKGQGEKEKGQGEKEREERGKGRYITCLKNGYIKEIDLNTNTATLYEVSFKSFSSSLGREMEEEGRRIPLHWDKMSLIPGRPREVLFLLGITQSLFYSTFPHPNSSLSLSTSFPSAGYIFGTPVIELYSHSGRITSLEVSSCGQMVSTGDENGYVKVLMITRPESLRYTITMKQYEKTETEHLYFQPIDPLHQRVGIRAHLGPIYSIKWINISSPSHEHHHQLKATDHHLSPSLSEESRPLWRYTDNEKEYFYLITGSLDRYVRIWSVVWSRQGIQITPFTQFDTVSAAVLSLSYQFLPSYSPSLSSPRSPLASTRSPSYSFSPSSPLLIAASLESGLVYLWTLPVSSLSHDQNRASQQENNCSLISLIHSSQYPLVNVVMSLVSLSLSDSNSISDCLLVVTSDVRGVVRIHSSPLSSLLSEREGEREGERDSTQLLFTLKGQASYDSPVISCRFLASSPGDSDSQAQRGNELSVYLATGELKLYPVRDLLDPPRVSLSLSPETLNPERPVNSLRLQREREEDENDKRYDEQRADFREKERERDTRRGREDTTTIDESIPNDRIPLPLSPPIPLSSPLHHNTDTPSVLSGQKAKGNSSSSLPSPSKNSSSSLHSPSKKRETSKSPHTTTDKKDKPLSPSLSPSVIPLSSSDYSEPSLHTSRTLSNYLQQMSGLHLEVTPSLALSPALLTLSQEISVSSDELSSETLRQQRADEIVNLPLHSTRYREDSLPRFTDSEIERRMPQKISLPPQIDKKWKQRLLSSAPSEECFQRVTPQDPVVTLNFISERNREEEGEIFRLKEREGEREVERYEMDIYLDDVFGPMDAKKTWERLSLPLDEQGKQRGSDPNLLSNESPFSLSLMSVGGFGIGMNDVKNSYQYV